MKLIIQPDDGLTPLLKGVHRASKSIDIVIFRLDRAELEKALEAAVTRGVNVRALIAHTNRGGEKRLRKLEQKLLDAGVTVTRTSDDLPRYHGKMLIADGRLYVCGFNYTKLDIAKSRSFGIVTRDPKLVKEATALFEADSNRQSYAPGHTRLVVSPETSRTLLSSFIRGAKKQLAIYDEKVTDNVIQRLLHERVKEGVEVKVIGKTEKSIDGIETRKLSNLRLHARAMIRDGAHAFVGSQSLRKLELDGRREVGVIVRNAAIAKKMLAVFESDWAQAAPKGSAKEKEKEKEAAAAP